MSEELSRIIIIFCALSFIILAVFVANTEHLNYSKRSDTTAIEQLPMEKIHTSITITQLKNNTKRRMMGYFIKTEHGKIIVIDGGNPEDSENLKKYIYENKGKVDYWFLTHFHSDHVGALADIINNSDIQIDNIVYNFCTRDMVEKYEPERLKQFDFIDNSLKNERVQNALYVVNNNYELLIDDVRIKILSVYHNDITENLGNNTSMIFKMYVNDKSILFLGDIGKEGSEKLLNENYKDLKSDYVQMSHHGQNGGTFELYNAIAPTYCFWPTPEWLWNNDNGGGYNSGEWKTIETRGWMEELNVVENYVEKDGDITLKIS